MKTKHWKRVCSLLMAVCLFTAMPGGALAETISEMEAHQAELEEKNQELEAKLEELSKDEAAKLEYQQTLQEKIDVVEAKIDTAREDINELNFRINTLTMKLKKSQEEIQDTIDKFKERLKALYKAGDVSTLEILLSANSFSEFTMRSEMVRAMTVHDQQLMQKIEDYRINTQDQREECEASKKKVAELKKQMEKEQDELDKLYQANAAAIAELENAQADTRRLVADNEEELANYEQMIQEAIEEQRRREEEAAAAAAAANNGGGNTYWGENVDYPSGGGGVEGFNPWWPLPGVSYISAGYGGYPGHRGLDIAGPYGTPVIAAESGVVIAANDYDSWGESWGYYVLVYHNSEFTTRYAHLSAVTVSNGQYVNQGDVVGYEGATGNVTGPHLHFEVYQNGTRVDPMIFL